MCICVTPQLRFHTEVGSEELGSCCFGVIENRNGRVLFCGRRRCLVIGDDGVGVAPGNVSVVSFGISCFIRDGIWAIRSQIKFQKVVETG